MPDRHSSGRCGEAWYRRRRRHRARRAPTAPCRRTVSTTREYRRPEVRGRGRDPRVAESRHVRRQEPGHRRRRSASRCLRGADPVPTGRSPPSLIIPVFTWTVPVAGQALQAEAIQRAVAVPLEVEIPARDARDHRALQRGARPIDEAEVPTPPVLLEGPDLPGDLRGCSVPQLGPDRREVLTGPSEIHASEPEKEACRDSHAARRARRPARRRGRRPCSRPRPGAEPRGDGQGRAARHR